MARKVVVELVDDIDGTIFGEDGANITFSVNGVNYGIDLKDKHASKFHKKIGFFSNTPSGSVSANADRIVRQPRRLRRGDAATRDVKEIRTWVAERGYEISSRGRIPAEVEQAYQDAH